MNITGVREDSYREILGADIADCEDQLFLSVSFVDSTRFTNKKENG